MIFEKFLVKRKEEGQNNMSRRLLKRSSKEEKDVEDDDSEAETQNKESYERADLQTQENYLQRLKQAFKEEGAKYFQYCSKRKITTHSDLEKVVSRPQAENSELFNVLKIA